MKKLIIFFALIVLILTILAVPSSASEFIETEAEGTDLEETDLTVSETQSAIITEASEKMTNHDSVPVSSWEWFKEYIGRDVDKTVLMALILLCALALILFTLVMAIRIIPDNKKTKRGVEKHTEISAEVVNMVRTVLDELKLGNSANISLSEEYRKKLDEMNSRFEALLNKEINQNYAAKEASIFVLDILYLLARRTALPMADKSALELWHTKGAELLQMGLTDEELTRIKEINSLILKSSGGDSHEQDPS